MLYLSYMVRKNIDLSEETVKKMKFVAASEDTDPKNWMQSVIQIAVNKKYNQLMYFKKFR